MTAAFSRCQQRFDAMEPDYLSDAEELDEAAIAAFAEHFKLSAFNQQKVRMVIADQRISDRY
jgi:hypothetical protein